MKKILSSIFFLLLFCFSQYSVFADYNSCAKVMQNNAYQDRKSCTRPNSPPGYYQHCNKEVDKKLHQNLERCKDPNFNSKYKSRGFNPRY